MADQKLYWLKSDPSVPLAQARKVSTLSTSPASTKICATPTAVVPSGMVTFVVGRRTSCEMVWMMLL